MKVKGKKEMKSLKHQFVGRLVVSIGLLAAARSAPAEDTIYKQPPRAVLEALKSLPTPGISVSPQRDYAIITHPSHRDPDLVKKLDAVAGRVLRGG